LINPKPTLLSLEFADDEPDTGFVMTRPPTEAASSQMVLAICPLIEPNDFVVEVHDRMPMLLKPEHSSIG